VNSGQGDSGDHDRDDTIAAATDQSGASGDTGNSRVRRMGSQIGVGSAADETDGLDGGGMKSMALAAPPEWGKGALVCRAVQRDRIS
jgi:hypothetical protein